MKRLRADLFPSVLLAGVFAVVLLLSAWVSDDAFITFRSIENFVNGYGPNYNIGQRVQTFTHPLWMLSLSAVHFILLKILGFSFTNQLYMLALGLSLLCTLTVVFLVARQAVRSPWGGALALVALTLSRAFMDYSTSGLENPLTHLLLVFLLLHVFQKEEVTGSGGYFVTGLLAGLVMLNRLDAALLVLPLVVFRWVRAKPFGRLRAGLQILAGLSPIVLWELFSLFYYGFPFPNTAYAKLNTGLPQTELLAQGGAYVLNSLRRDPITLGFTLLVPIMALLARPARSWPGWPALAGAALYVLYVLRIGGDFMSGRFFAAPLLIAAVLITRLPALPGGLWAAAGSFSLAAGLLLSPQPTLFAGTAYGISGDDYDAMEELLSLIDPYGIADERAVYYRVTGLARMNPYFLPVIGSAWEGDNWDPTGQPGAIRYLYAAGFAGYMLGPAVEVVDLYALLDPLLARLPPTPDEDWRIGHHIRALPDGYHQSRLNGDDQFLDPALGEYNRQLRQITEGDLLSWERLKTVVRFNLGYYEPLLAGYLAGQ